MPERILRDITDSDPYNAVDANCRDLFIRLINKADDYGCFHADATRLRSSLYPLLLTRIRESDVTRWIASCEKAGLIRLYEDNGKQYLQVCKWRQRLRNDFRKFPIPPWPESDIFHYGKKKHTNGHAAAMRPRTNTNTETNTEAGDEPVPDSSEERSPAWKQRRTPTR